MKGMGDPLLLLLLPPHVVDDESDNGGGSGDDGDHDNFLDRCIPAFLPPSPHLPPPRSDICRAAETLAMRARQLRDIGRREGSADAEGCGEAVIPLSFAPSLPSHQPHAKKVTQRESFPLPPHFPPFPSLSHSSAPSFPPSL